MAAVGKFVRGIVPGEQGPLRITAGCDGNLWFTEATGNRIGRITPAGAVTEFPVITPNAGPFGITAGPDGNLWFTEILGNRIGRIGPGAVAGCVTPPVPPAPAQAVPVAAAPLFTG